MTTIITDKNFLEYQTKKVLLKDYQILYESKVKDLFLIEISERDLNFLDQLSNYEEFDGKWYWTDDYYSKDLTYLFNMETISSKEQILLYWNELAYANFITDQLINKAELDSEDYWPVNKDEIDKLNLRCNGEFEDCFFNKYCHFKDFYDYCEKMYFSNGFFSIAHQIYLNSALNKKSLEEFANLVKL